jgi:hypothetical protein
LFDHRKRIKRLTFVDELKNHEFNLKVERNFNEYLSCCIEESKGEGKLTMIQLHLLTHLKQNFGDGIKGFLTLGMTRFKIQKSTINMDVLDVHHQRRHRSEVGILLWVTIFWSQNL